MFSRPKILFLVSLLFVALLNPKFNPYLLFKFLIFYHSSIKRASTSLISLALLYLYYYARFMSSLAPARACTRFHISPRTRFHISTRTRFHFSPRTRFHISARALHF